MESFITNIITSLGYVGIALIMCIEMVFPPIPSELVMPFAGFSAAQGQMSLIGVILAGSVGSTTGATIIYMLTHHIPDATIYRFVHKYGKWVGITEKDVKRADKWFDDHANKAVFFGRMVPGIRSAISIPAGLSKMPLMPFLIYTSAGSLIWTTFLALVGYFLGDQYEVIIQILDTTKYVIVGAITLTAVGFIAYRLTKKRRKKH